MLDAAWLRGGVGHVPPLWAGGGLATSEDGRIAWSDGEGRLWVTLNLDLRQMGVGGDNSWGAKPLAKYMIPAAEYRYRYRLVPLAPGDEPAELGKARPRSR